MRTINFSLAKIQRIVMHEIIPSKGKKNPATVEYDDALIEIDGNVEKTLLERLNSALGKESKSFQLNIEKNSEDSFYGLASRIKECDDESFVKISCSIANLLASAQTKANMPGGFLLTIECNYSQNKKLYIVIKAEPQKVITKNKQDGKSKLDVLNNVFLSPASKLYKIGILIENDLELKEPNDKFKCYLFDEQFRNDGTPASYFYKDFLGFTISKNAKIQTKLFYDKTSEFIKRNFNDFQEKSQLLKQLNLLFTIETSLTITPKEFSKNYFKDPLKQDIYFSDVVSQLPGTITKDSTLIDTQLKTKKIIFSDNIRIIGPDNSFDQNVRILTKQEELDNLSFKNGYSIVIIEGRPFQPNE